MQTKRPQITFLILLPLSVLALNSCQQHSVKDTSGKENPIPKESTPSSPKPSVAAEKDLGKMISELKTSMISYMKTAEPPYTIDDVNSCEMILKWYLTDIQASKEKNAGMKIVRTAIMRLNRLNSNVGETLIETGEREKIAEIIILASSRKGYNTLDEDITEEWREW